MGGLKISLFLKVTMAFKFIISAAFLAGFLFMSSNGAPSSTDVEDFEEDHYGYTYIYHDAKDLLLTVHNHSCYFIKADDNHDHSDRFLATTSRSDTSPARVMLSRLSSVKSFVRTIPTR